MGGLTLSEAYTRALSERGDIRISHLDRDRAGQEKRIAIGNLLPRLSATATGVWEEERLSNNRLTDVFQHSSKLSFEQPLFQGGGEFFAWKAAASKQESQTWKLRQAELDLYERVAHSFFQLLLLKQRLSNLEDKTKILSSQVRYYEERARIGQSKQSDLASTRSQLALSSAESLQVQIQLDQAERELQWLLGLDQSPSPEHVSFAFDINALSKAELLSQNPNLRFYESQIQQARNLKRLAQADYLPRVDTTGDYFLHRSGSGSASDWGVSLTATWEFFSGFQTRALSSIRDLELQRLEIEYRDFKTKLISEFESIKNAFLKQKENLERIEEAVRLSQKSYEFQKKDATLNLVSALDVLRSLESYIDSKSLLDQQRIEQQHLWIKLNLLFGRIP